MGGGEGKTLCAAVIQREGKGAIDVLDRGGVPGGERGGAPVANAPGQVIAVRGGGEEEGDVLGVYRTVAVQVGVRPPGAAERGRP